MNPIRLNSANNIMSCSEYFTASESESEYCTASEGEDLPTGDGCSSIFGIKASASFRAKKKRFLKKKGVQKEVEKKWTFDETEPRGMYKLRKHVRVDAVLMEKYYKWRRAIIAGQHPKNAVDIIGCGAFFKKINQKKGIDVFSIRLSSEHRVYFSYQENKRVVTVWKIGGHSFP
ncbi:hypothetical protein [Edwardsiella tarda]|uniref:Uncharacterized protein n=1 Tax=Edwardsiella tarda TaxID=636 RepID=A0A2A7U666_EDWTA|nr:hypothetical protein [Edwardsiella tarda]PEH73896.1 hypothetical protein CRM76_19185 [Edwardsiella tarda]